MDKEIESVIGSLIHHSTVRLVDRGNTAILAALTCAKSSLPVLIPDQGGWITYFKYPKQLGMERELLFTKSSLIDLEELDQKSKECSVFLYANPGGYFVNQPVEEIYSICKKNNCLVIMDVTGCVGTKRADGRFADFIVCSFSRGKPVNLGHGGFISCNDSTLLDPGVGVIETGSFDTTKLQLLAMKLKDLPSRYELLYFTSEKVKKDFSEYDVLYRDHEAINVLIRYSNEKELSKITSYCEKNNYKYKICKKVKDSTKSLFSFIKVNEDAVSIDLQYL